MKKILVLLSLTLSSVAAHASDLMRTVPFLQNPTDGGVTITWLTNQPSFSYVEYGTDRDNLTRAVTMVDGQIIAGNKIHRIRLEGIEPGETYYYRAVSKEITHYGAYKKTFGDSIATNFHEFVLPEKGTDYRAVVFNDLHRRNATAEALAEQVEDSDYNIAIFNGDCIDDPNNEADVVNFLAHAAKVIGKSSVPMVFIRGNHEIRGAHSIWLRDIIEYSTEKSYGAFTWGDTRFVILDCGEDKPDDHWVYYGLNDFEGFREEQVGFLERELKNREHKRAEHRVLIHHIPIYLNEEVSKKVYNPCYALWSPVLEDSKFDIAINAHTHKHAYHPEGTVGNPFPILIGGGHKLEEAGVTLIESVGDDLKVSYITAHGERNKLYDSSDK